MPLRFYFLLLCLAGFSCVTPAASSSSAPSSRTQDNWIRLGERTVNHAVDRDEIRVGPREGSFRRIQLRVRNRAVTFRDVRVHYANGTVQDIELRRQIPAGGQTRAIDLTGQDRIISRVVFFYNTAPRRGRRAVVRLYGHR